MHPFKRFWHDTHGDTGAMSVILITTILAIGAIVGLTSVRDQIVQEFGDAAVALEKLDQSFSYSSAFATVTFVDPPTTLTDPAGAEPACLSVQAPATPEGP